MKELSPTAYSLQPDGLPVLLCAAPETPRMTIAIVIDGGMRRESIPGAANLAANLLLKGTESRNAETLALELDEHAIDLQQICSSDCSLLTATFLNREFPVALDILQDVLLHSTFADFEKEAAKMAGEIQSSLDMPATRARDLLQRTMFSNHPYGHTGTRILEALPQLNMDLVQNWHRQGLCPGSMTVALVGDIETDDALSQISGAFSNFSKQADAPSLPVVSRIAKDIEVTETRQEAQQAQVFQGWYAPGFQAPERAALLVMNGILGGGGLSNRLYLELREKQGLAYAVNSMYIPMQQIGEFIMAIGTSPENIGRARQGFAEQLERLQQEPVTEEELDKAKGRARGAFILGHETNYQRCMDMAVNQLLGLGYDFSERLLAAMEQVSIEEVRHAAQLITSPSVTAIAKPE